MVREELHGCHIGPDPANRLWSLPTGTLRLLCLFDAAIHAVLMQRLVRKTALYLELSHPALMIEWMAMTWSGDLSASLTSWNEAEASAVKICSYHISFRMASESPY